MDDEDKKQIKRELYERPKGNFNKPDSVSLASLGRLPSEREKLGMSREEFGEYVQDDTEKQFKQKRDDIKSWEDYEKWMIIHDAITNRGAKPTDLPVMDYLWYINTPDPGSKLSSTELKQKYKEYDPMSFEKWED